MRDYIEVVTPDKVYRFSPDNIGKGGAIACAQYHIYSYKLRGYIEHRDGGLARTLSRRKTGETVVVRVVDVDGTMIPF